MSTDTALGPFTLFYSLPADFAFASLPPGNPGGSRLIVGDPANGDSILAFFLGINSGVMRRWRSPPCGPLDHCRRNGSFALGARGHFTTDQCSNLDTGETGGTIRGTIIVR